MDLVLRNLSKQYAAGPTDELAHRIAVALLRSGVVAEVPTKLQVEQMINTYFDSKDAIYDEYFQVDDEFPTYDFDLERNNSTWRISGGRLHYDFDEDGDPQYVGEIASLRAITAPSVYRQEHFTLVFCTSESFGSGSAIILDNDKELKSRRNPYYWY